MFKDFTAFLQKPNTSNYANSIGQDLFLFVLLTALVILGVLLKAVVVHQPIIEESDLDVLAIDKIIIYVLIIPMIEEFAFRGYLVSEKKKYLVISLIAAIIIVFSYVKNPTISYSLIALIFVFSIIVLVNQSAYKSLIKLIRNNRLILVYASSILFGFAHFSNYESFELINIIPISIKVLAGLFFSYIVLKYKSIWYAIALHSVNNLLPTVLIFLYKICR